MLSFLKSFSRYSSNRLLFEFIYLFNNPWNLKSKEEIYRYEYLNRFLINKNEGKKYKSILEIGCGEGDHTNYLSNIANTITSIDISKIAIFKARKKNINNAFFFNKIIEDIDFNKKFDLIIASEVIYYIKDIKNFIEKIEKFRVRYIITYYSIEDFKLQNYFNDENYFTENFKINNFEWILIFKGF